MNTSIKSICIKYYYRIYLEQSDTSHNMYVKNNS